MEFQPDGAFDFWYSCVRYVPRVTAGDDLEKVKNAIAVSISTMCFCCITIVLSTNKRWHSTYLRRLRVRLLDNGNRYGFESLQYQPFD